MINSLPPAQLWIGSPVELSVRVCSYLQSIWCSYESCGSCTTCKQIANKAYFALRWVQPEKQQYSLEQVKTLTSSLSFMLDEGEKFFVVFQDADLLSTSAANALLKTLEEPLPGYHFLLLAAQKESILPTIASRCVISYYDLSIQQDFKEFVAIFTERISLAHKDLQKELDKAVPSEFESRKILDQITAYWLDQYRLLALSSNASSQETIQKQQRLARLLELFRKSLQRLPMPGSGKIFWRNLYLHYIDILGDVFRL
jgi:hypothetical protein